MLAVRLQRIRCDLPVNAVGPFHGRGEHELGQKPACSYWPKTSNYSTACNAMLQTKAKTKLKKRTTSWCGEGHRWPLPDLFIDFGVVEDLRNVVPIQYVFANKLSGIVSVGSNQADGNSTTANKRLQFWVVV